MSIRQGETLNRYKAEGDEAHITPLQLDVIENLLRLYTNPGDLVFSPFAGIGSEGYQAILMDRQFTGIELKKEYYAEAIKNLRQAQSERNQNHLFDL